MQSLRLNLDSIPKLNVKREGILRLLCGSIFIATNGLSRLYTIERKENRITSGRGLIV